MCILNFKGLSGPYISFSEDPPNFQGLRAWGLYLFETLSKGNINITYLSVCRVLYSIKNFDILFLCYLLVHLLYKQKCYQASS